MGASEGGNTRGDTEVVRAYCDAWVAGDTTTVLSLYHHDLTLHWPGRHRLAGTHVGQEASTEALLALQAATNRVPVEILDVLTGANEVMVTVKERWSGEDAAGRERTLEHARALEYTVADGQLRTCRVYETAQHEIDDWLAG